MSKLFLEAKVKAIEAGVFEVVASTGQVDRMGDTIDPKGWYLNNYKKNPVVLWAHNNFEPPVARANKVWVENDKELKLQGVFAPTPFAQEIRTLVENGFLSAVSVGFMPLAEDQKGNIEIDGKTYRRMNDEEMKDFQKGIYRDGQKFTKQELLEVSWVDVPALPYALVNARKMGLALVTKELESMEKENEISGECADHKGILLINGICAECEKAKVKSPACRMDNETQDECIARKIPEIMHDDPEMNHDQAVAIAVNMCKTKCGKDFEPEIEKEGRVISGKNRTLINNAITQMGEAIAALQDLLDASDPNKGADPSNDKGRRPLKRKKSQQEEALILLDKVVEITLLKLRQNET